MSLKELFIVKCYVNFAIEQGLAHQLLLLLEQLVQSYWLLRVHLTATISSRPKPEFKPRSLTPEIVFFTPTLCHLSRICAFNHSITALNCGSVVHSKVQLMEKNKTVLQGRGEQDIPGNVNWNIWREK